MGHANVVKSCRDVRHFVCLANYCYEFVRVTLSAVTVLLTALCSPGDKCISCRAADSVQSFDAFNASAALTSSPVLRVWDTVWPTCLLTDASERPCRPCWSSPMTLFRSIASRKSRAS